MNDVLALQVAAREIPVPAHLSPEAKGYLAMAMSGEKEYPAIDDHQEWKRLIEEFDSLITDVLTASWPAFNGEVHVLTEGEARAFEIVPAAVERSDRRVCLDFHGGALIMGGGELCKIMAGAMADKLGVRLVSVDYRMAPDHPYPAGLDDCMRFYRRLLRDHDPRDIVVSGASAGANLAAALILRARDEGLPLPAGAILISPEIDLTESGDSFNTNAGIDAMGSLMDINRLYAAGHDLSDPYISPLFGDVSKGFPPTLLTAGTRDLFLSNAARMHRKLRSAGVPAELHILEAAPHGGFGGMTPEEKEIDADIRLFCEKLWAR